MERRDIALINPKYLTSAVEAKQYPCEERPEIAFLGRSNVGKSSLINSLCNQRGLAKVSGAPGKTRTINFFTGELRERVDGESTYPVTALPRRAVRIGICGVVLSVTIFSRQKDWFCCAS